MSSGSGGCDGGEGLNIYFAGAIGNSDDASRERMKRVIPLLQRYGRVLTEHIGWDHVRDWEAENERNGVNVHDRDVEWLAASDVMVVDMGRHSTGVGYEIAYALDRAIPVFVFAQDGCDVSRMIRQNTRSGMEFIRYVDTEGMCARLDGILSKPLPRRKFDGKFIVLDGMDFSGKGTQVRNLVTYLMDHPQDRTNKLITVVATREPYNSPFTPNIRHILQTEKDPLAQAHKLADLFVADRKYHDDKLIRPALLRGDVVVSDRFKFSTLAYQWMQGVPLERLLEMHRGISVPDLTFLVTIPAAVALERKAAARGKSPDEMFDQLGAQEKLRENYLALPEILKGERIVVIDGVNSREETSDIIKSHVDALLFPK